MKEPRHFWTSVFWDGKTKTYSASRVIMMLGFLLTLAQFGIVSYIVLDAYKQAKTIPDLSWYLYGSSAGVVSGVGGYAFNRYGSRNDPMGTVDQDEEDDEPNDNIPDDIPAHPTPEGEEVE